MNGSTNQLNLPRPQRLTPSPMHLRLRGFRAGPLVKLDRFQLIDFDFV